MVAKRSLSDQQELAVAPTDLKMSLDDLTARRKDLIRQSWSQIEITANSKFTTAFYEQLFVKYPQVAPLFDKIPLEIQAMKLYEVVCVAVRCMDDLTQLIPVLQDLGRRHAVSYQVERQYYAAVTQVFVEVLYDYLKASCRDDGPASLLFLDITDAWSWILTLIGNIMADAGDEAIFELEIAL